MNGIWILIGVIAFILLLFRYIEKLASHETVKPDIDNQQNEILPANEPLTIVPQQNQIQESSSYIVLDTETTGLSEHDEIIEISIIDQNGHILLDTLIRPSSPMPDDCFAITIHGITNSMLENAPTWKEIYPEFKKIISGKQVVIYNAAFDTRLIEQTCRPYGLGVPKEIRRAKCAMLAFAEWVGQWDSYRNSFRWHKLEKAADILLIEFDGQKHRALSDCRVTLAVWQYIHNHTRQEALENLKQCLKEQQQQSEEHRKALQLQVMKDVREILDNPNNIVLNINACGKIETSQILEIAVVDMSGKVLLDTFVKPNRKIGGRPRYLQCWHMEAKDFDNYPKWSDIYEKLIEITNGKTVYVVEDKWKVSSLIKSENYKYSLEHKDLNFMEISFGNRGYIWKTADRTDFRDRDEYDIYRSKTACHHFICVLNHVAQNGLSDFMYE